MSTSPGSAKKRKASDMADTDSDPHRRPEKIPASPKPRSIMDLPPELVNQILDHLIPNLPEIDEPAPEAFDKLVREDPWYDFTRRRSALRNLCLVSHFFADLARPYLYHTIAITSEEVLVLLFRTITENPDYCGWTRSLSCHLTLTNSRVVRKTKRCLNKLLPTWREGKGLVFITGYLESLQMRRASTDPDEYYEMAQGILGMTMTALYSLETLLLQLPAIDHDRDYFELISCLRITMSYFNTEAGEKCRRSYLSILPEDVRSMIPDRLESAALTPFQHLTTLLLQGDPSVEDPTTLDDDDTDDGDPPEVFGVQTRHYHPLFELLPALTTLEVSTDDGLFTFLDGEEGLTDVFARPTTSFHLSPTRHIYLHSSVADPRNIGRILRHAPDLETLYMNPRRVDSFHRIPPQDATQADEDCLDQALSKYGKKLKHLDLNWFDCQGSEASIGVGGRLSTLPQLKEVEKLCIQLVMLYGDLPAGEHMMHQGRPVADLLPPNLVELTLEDWWWDSLDDFDTFYRWSDKQKKEHYREKEGYRETVLEMMKGLALVAGRNAKPPGHGESKMHKLKRFRFFIRTLPTWILPGDDEKGPDADVQELFEGVREVFEKAGVEFVVEVDQPLEMEEEMQ
ncbi:hypothetical protein NCU08559 [Neurospora crassa OR74A]|uniref:Uncharacterized protein n=2 Tax=Neurospora crassa TaxID=5141 RepID=U9W3T2_NEUCR|nr:hypothetical protein NCU08559 [Neurospora crassa OR74A]ESA43452.1 hypothetical protein NCU08559 [Neurospora crassa OR74A]CAE85496.1 hypothetical protein B13M15.060 [Neurospora crassa]|eukprot:XP_011393961.1 hypothetical protein NCU08559 [Neurospora crassa OR74A]